MIAMSPWMDVMRINKAMPNVVASQLHITLLSGHMSWLFLSHYARIVRLKKESDH